MTFLQVVNAVLRRLREEPVPDSDSTEYSQLIRQFVNEAKEDIEHRWDWSRLRHTIMIQTVPGETKYIAHGVDGRVRVMQVLDDTNNRVLQYGRWKAMNRAALMNSGDTGKPMYVDRNGFDAYGDTIFEVWPIPDGGYNIAINAVIPQEEYLTTDLDEYNVEIPTHPLILGAYLRAIEERGDDATSRYEFNAKLYQDAVAQAIISDMAQQEDEQYWEVE